MPPPTAPPPPRARASTTTHTHLLQQPLKGLGHAASAHRAARLALARCRRGRLALARLATHLHLVCACVLLVGGCGRATAMRRRGWDGALQDGQLFSAATTHRTCCCAPTCAHTDVRAHRRTRNAAHPNTRTVLLRLAQDKLVVVGVSKPKRVWRVVGVVVLQRREARLHRLRQQRSAGRVALARVGRTRAAAATHACLGRAAGLCRLLCRALCCCTTVPHVPVDATTRARQPCAATPCASASRAARARRLRWVTGSGAQASTSVSQRGGAGCGCTGRVQQQRWHTPQHTRVLAVAAAFPHGTRTSRFHGAAAAVGGAASRQGLRA
jgi:hypothetical protein